jgi:methylmalonyl-CoA mutase N-terminal domain/subunit
VAASGRCGSIAGFGSAASQCPVRYLLAHGVTGLSVAFDLPPRMGYDSDHRWLPVKSAGSASHRLGGGHGGLLDGIPLDRVSTSVTINATAIILLSYHRGGAAAERGGPTLSGTIQNDILGEYRARFYHLPASR